MSGMVRFNVLRNRLIPKILKMLSGHQNDSKLNSVTSLAVVVIMNISVTKYINRYSCVLFKNCCDRKITFFAYVFVLIYFR